MFGCVGSQGKLRNILLGAEASEKRYVGFSKPLQHANNYAYVGTLAGYNGGTITNVRREKALVTVSKVWRCPSDLQVIAGASVRMRIWAPLAEEPDGAYHELTVYNPAENSYAVLTGEDKDTAQTIVGFTGTVAAQDKGFYVNIYDEEGRLFDMEKAEIRETILSEDGASAAADPDGKFQFNGNDFQAETSYKGMLSSGGTKEYQYRQTKGRRTVVPGGAETVKELCKRGYTLGIISDLVGKREVDEWLDADGLRPYFKTVQQSSITYVRKPGPAIYYYAMEEVGARAENCCYVGDNLNRDIVGAKACDFGMTVAVQYNKNKPLELTEENMPDAKVHAFPQLLDIFPACGQVAVDNLILPTEGQ